MYKINVLADVRYYFSILLLFILSCAGAQNSNLKIITWNIQDFGQTKSDEEIELMAKLLKGYDIIAIQEVVAKDPAGAQAVARLVGQLDRTGSDYDYCVSEATHSSSSHISERYAFVWRTSTVKVRGKPMLLKSYQNVMEREPFLAEFSWESKSFRVATVHMRSYSSQPEQEIAAMRGMMNAYHDMPLFVAGDFNVVSKHTVFNPWKSRGYRLAIEGHKTTFATKEVPGRDIYSKEKDNILVPAHQVNMLEGGSLDVYEYLGRNLAAARALSDHVPVYVIIEDY